MVQSSTFLNHLKAILWKSWVIRKRHWILTSLEGSIPIFMFIAITFARSKMPGLNKVYINESTYHDVHDLHSIYAHLDTGSLQLWYAPYCNETEEIIKKVQWKLGIPGEATKGFDSRDEMLTYENFSKDTLVAAVIFDKISNIADFNYDLTIYQKYLNWKTNELFVSTFEAEEKEHSNYLTRGYAALQLALDMSFIEISAKRDDLNVTISLQQFPDPPHVEDSKLNQLFIHFLPLGTIFSSIFLCPSVLHKVGEEKASGSKEMMKMVGLRSSMIWFGWSVYALTINSISIVGIIVLMKVPLWGVPYSLIEHSDGTVLFVFLYLYSTAAITLCFLIANLFEKPSLATIFGLLFWILSYFVPQSIVTSLGTMLWRFKIIFGVLPNMTLFYGYSSMSFYEMREIGLQWNNIFEPGSGDDQDITMGCVLIMLITDTVIFMLLTLYIENVKPGKYGIPKPLKFPLLYALTKLRHNKDGHNNDEELGLMPKSDKTAIIVRNLQKKYSSNVSLDELNMDVPENRRTVLLGENGSGKTTAMSILTGMCNLTSGTVLINGKDLKRDADEIRKSMGLCPQHNLLFNDLTVEEHLYFFGMLKGLKKIRQKTDIILNKFNIIEKKKSFPNILSGGMKRKLCLAIALLGEPKILILDEPTSGMDPESRHAVWTTLSELRGTTVLVSTHTMEEAEYLGHQILVMANGRLQDQGTSAELKLKYGAGYNLSLFLNSTKGIRQIKDIVFNLFVNAKVKQKTKDSIVFLLPFSKETKLSYLVAELEERSDIENIDISVTTLNDVFLKAKDANDGHVEGDGYRLFVLQSTKDKNDKIRETVWANFPEATIMKENTDSVMYFLTLNQSDTNDKIEKLITELSINQQELHIVTTALSVTASTDLTIQDEVDQSNMAVIIDDIHQQNQGYHLCLVLKSKRYVHKIEEEINRFSGVKKIQENDGYILYLLPLNNRNKCQKIVATLENKQDEWDIYSINMNVTKLPGLSLKVQDETMEDEVDSIKNDLNPTILTNLHSLILKRTYFFATTLNLFVTIIISVLLIFILLLLSIIPYNSRSIESPLQLSLHAYGSPNVNYAQDSLNNLTKKISECYERSVEHGHGKPMLQISTSESIIEQGTRNFAFFKEHMIAAAEFNTSGNDQVRINAMYSSNALHAVPISLNLATNAILKIFSNNLSINVRNTPLKALNFQLTQSELSLLSVTSAWLLLMPTSLFVLGSYFILFAHSEVSTDFIKLQTKFQITTRNYWFSNILIDIFTAMIPIVLLLFSVWILNMAAFDSKTFEANEICAFGAIFATYICTSLPFTYTFGYAKTLTGGIGLFFILGIFTGIVPVIIITALDFSDQKSLVQIMNFAKPLLNILSPQFALSEICVKFSQKFVENFNWKVMDPLKRQYICETDPNPCCFDPFGTLCEAHESYFQNDKLGIQENLFLLSVTLVLYFVVLLFLNMDPCSGKDFLRFFKFLSWPCLQSRNDSNTDEKKALEVDGLKTTYGKKEIIKNLKFDVLKKQCFGLLGVNGAGKTTAFRTLTKYLALSEGNVKLMQLKNTVDIKDPEYCKKVGYCPQENSLNHFLTGRQLLTTIGILKGHSYSSAQQNATSLLKKMGLSKHGDKPCGHYSGGNKRKLSTCLAFLGCPAVIFLDEPTTGVDPASQRKFWKLLLDRKKYMSFLLCSHSMEECENLCENVGIMKHGKIEVQGSPVALKKEHGGYKLTIQKGSASNPEDIVKVKNEICTLVGASILEELDGALFAKVQKNNASVKISKIFRNLSKLKNMFPTNIKDYIVNNDLSLEDVFLDVARHP